MQNETTNVTVKQVDYAGVFGFTRLFQCFRMAVVPSRLVLALLFIVLAFLTGQLLDTVWGARVIAMPGRTGMVHTEWERYKALPVAQYKEWVERTSQDLKPEAKRGVFDEIVDIERELFQNMVQAAIGLRFGLDQISPSAMPNQDTVFGCIRQLLLTLPGWLWHGHKGFLISFLLIVGVLWALLGGAISRQMMLAATVDRIVPMSEAVAFAWKRLPTFILAPLSPLGLQLGMALLLAVGGLLFYFPVLNILAGLAFILALGVAFAMTLLLVLWFGGVHMMYPAICAQGADALDAMARSISYVMARPWRLLFYSLTALVYGAATYVFVALFLYLMAFISQWAVGAWVNDFNEVMPPPHFGQPPPFVEKATGEGARSTALFFSSTDTLASKAITVWLYLLIGVLGAYAINFYLATYTWVYLLLRRQTDGDDLSEVFEPYPPPLVPIGEKVDPVVQAVAASADSEGQPAD